MANKKVCQLVGMIQNVIVSILRVVTCVDFHVVSKENGTYANDT
jgi:hypothetical protein